MSFFTIEDIFCTLPKSNYYRLNKEDREIDERRKIIKMTKDMQKMSSMSRTRSRTRKIAIH